MLQFGSVLADRSRLGNRTGGTANEKKNPVIKVGAALFYNSSSSSSPNFSSSTAMQCWGYPAAWPDNAGTHSVSKEQTINQQVLLELMIDEPLHSLHLVVVSGIRFIWSIVECRDIDCLISTVRRDSRSVFPSFLHLVRSLSPSSRPSRINS